MVKGEQTILACEQAVEERKGELASSPTQRDVNQAMSTSQMYVRRDKSNAISFLARNRSRGNCYSKVILTIALSTLARFDGSFTL